MQRTRWHYEGSKNCRVTKRTQEAQQKERKLKKQREGVLGTFDLY